MKRVFLFALFVFSSCSSFRIPEEEKVILKNIATEYYTLGDGYLEVKNYKKAAECYKLAMRNENLKTAAFYKLARSYALAQDWTLALSCYEELLKKDEKNFSLRSSVAYIKAMSGETDEAILLFGKLIEENPNDEQTQENLVSKRGILF